MKLLKWLFFAVSTGAVVWFGATVRLGKRTLFGHLVAIAGTPEAKDLADGTRQEARRVVERMRDDLGRDGGAPPARPDDRQAGGAAEKPAERIDEEDRAALRKLLSEKRAKVPKS